MLNKKLIVTEVDGEGWFLTFDGLMTTNDSIKIDEETAREIWQAQGFDVQ